MFIDILSTLDLSPVSQTGKLNLRAAHCTGSELEEQGASSKKPIPFPHDVMSLKGAARFAHGHNDDFPHVLPVAYENSVRPQERPGQQPEATISTGWTEAGFRPPHSQATSCDRIVCK